MMRIKIKTNNMVNLIHKELSYQITGILFEVQNELGTKFQEKYYQKAVAQLLKKNRIPFTTETPVNIKFEDVLLGTLKADMIVDNKILLEFKTVDRLNIDHKQQTLRYLDGLNLKLGLLVNFRVRPLQIWRIIN